MDESESVEIPSNEILLSNAWRSLPRIVILEQPAKVISRFRYKCEKRKTVQLYGRTSTPMKPTYPTIQIIGNEENLKILIVVSCVTKEPPYLAHPYELEGEHCKEGIFKARLEALTENSCVKFYDLGIRSIASQETHDSLRLRERKKVNPFKNGFDHITNPHFKFEHKSLRLCFQAFIICDNNRRIELEPVVSEEIRVSKSVTSVKIRNLCNRSVPADGSGAEITLMCKHFIEGDVEVQFKDNANWNSFGKIVWHHKSTALVVKTPAYVNPDIDRDIEIQVRLYRVSDKIFGDPVYLIYTPTDRHERRRRRLRTHSENFVDNQTTYTPPQIISDSSENTPSTSQGPVPSVQPVVIPNANATETENGRYFNLVEFICGEDKHVIPKTERMLGAMTL